MGENEPICPDRAAAAHPAARRGRGAVSNASGRYEAEQRLACDDGWGSMDEAPPPLRTSVTEETPRTIIARNTSPDIGFDRSINPYRGCEHGCVYCYARPTHARMGLSPGLDFESRLFCKPQAATLLRRELAAPGYRCAPIAMGTNTDPYQPIERQRRITREVLEVLAEYRHPVTIVTKSALVLRDADILAPMAAAGLVKVALSVTTLDGGLARRLEPRAAAPHRRLEAIRQLAGLGIPVGVMVAPLIPGLTDHELEAILNEAAAAGAGGAGYIMLRLPLEIKDLVREWLRENAPNRAARVLSLVQGLHGGRDYDASFHRRQTGGGPFAAMIARRFQLACQRLGFDGAGDGGLDCGQFRPPPRDARQGSLALF